MGKSIYQELIERLRHLIDEGDLESATQVVDEELRMPYIPPDIEPVLRQLKAHIDAQKPQAPRASVLTPSQIVAYLYGDEEHQLAAIVALSALNLRAQLPLIREAFEVLSTRELKSLLVRVCLDQALNEEFIFEDDGIRYTFIPAVLTSPERCEGYLTAKAQLIAWLSSDNPSLLNLALQELEHAVLLQLPETYDEDEALDLALRVLYPIYIQLYEESEWRDFLHLKGLAHPLSTH